VLDYQVVRVLPFSSGLLALVGVVLLGQIPVERLNPESGQYRLLSTQLMIHSIESYSAYLGGVSSLLQ